mmetsp:Transcript_22746/g.31688  ORF Transcript_22746/g.31688 Transcript_22746/m.31688 type:complete len:440 (-) Transcript_22746:3082-4401(-)
MPPTPVVEVVTSLATNPYFSAGFGLVGVGTGMAALRNGYRYATLYAKRNMLISCEIPSKDKSYSWFMDWMSRKEGRRTQHVSVETSYIQYENGEISTKMSLTPSTGTHFMNYKGYWIKIDRTREKNVVDMTSGSLWETITLTTVGRSRKIFEEILEEARQNAVEKEEGSTVIYTTSGGDWRRFGFPRKRRPLHSVILADGIAETVLDDVTSFLSNAKWYIDRGIPYRRGYLLYGPPGCGKSSFIMALAGELHLNICILNLQGKGINDDVLNQLLNVAPQRSIVLLEDIDTAVEKGPHNALTFSGLLNALDGVAATEGGGRILFMTTNHLHKLPPALVRPGRVDMKFCLDHATTSQLKRMFLKFFPTNDQMANEFAQCVPHKSVSMAQLQAYFMTHRENPHFALENCGELLAHSGGHSSNTQDTQLVMDPKKPNPFFQDS